MTNYNERLDEILKSCTRLGVFHPYLNEVHLENEKEAHKETKQALTSLIKELVAEAKPKEMDSFYEKPIVDEFEQNILKALEQL